MESGHSLNIFLNQNTKIVQNKDAAKTKKKSTFFDYVFFLKYINNFLL